MAARLATINLNALTSGNPGPRSNFDWTITERRTESGAVTAHLGDIGTPLAAFLSASESVVGCVAWITSTRMVDALLGKPVSLIVNKEFSLRKTDTKPAAVRNRANLARLTGGLRRRDFAAPLNHPVGENDYIDPVRCAGQTPSARTSNSPLMHHKFVVRLEGGKPVAVFSGSFNFTRNAETNFENALEIHDPVIAAAYLAEWERVAAISEPLEFLAGKASPDWGGPRRTTTPAIKASPTAPKVAIAPEAPRRRLAPKPVKKRVTPVPPETERTPLTSATNARKRKPVVRKSRTPKSRRPKALRKK